MTPQKEQTSRPGNDSTAASVADTMFDEMELWVGVQSDAGPVRDLNEDHADCFVPAEEDQRRKKGAIFLVADGMGGHQAGEVASGTAAKQVIHEYYADTAYPPGDSLVRAFKIANQVLYDQAQTDPSKVGMGTTMVAAVVLGSQVFVANVGDSRAYLVTKQGLSQITQDHSWVEEQVQAGILTRAQAAKHPQRNLITRALGAKPSVEVDLFRGELHEGDGLLLCSDGLSSVLSGEQMASVALAQSPPQAAAQLIAQAKAWKAEDNISAVLVKAVRPRPHNAQKRAAEVEAEDDRPTVASEANLVASRRSKTVKRWLRDLGARAQATSGSRRWILIAVAAVLVSTCVCGSIALLALGQKLAGNSAAAPHLAPIRYESSATGDPGEWASYLGYADLGQMTATLGTQPDSANSLPADLWPARPGVFVVGLARNWACQDQKCAFRLEMAGQEYDVDLELQFVAKEVTTLDRRRVRVFGFQEESGGPVTAGLIDLGGPWWAWWRPAWGTVYQNHTWGDSVWVYSIADRNPYSLIRMEDYALTRGEPILLRGKWLQGTTDGSMSFDLECLYRLAAGRYSLSVQPTPVPRPTVTLRPGGG